MQHFYFYTSSKKMVSHPVWAKSGYIICEQKGFAQTTRQINSYIQRQWHSEVLQDKEPKAVNTFGKQTAHQFSWVPSSLCKSAVE